MCTLHFDSVKHFHLGDMLHTFATVVREVGHGIGAYAKSMTNIGHA